MKTCSHRPIILCSSSSGCVPDLFQPMKRCVHAAQKTFLPPGSFFHSRMSSAPVITTFSPGAARNRIGLLLRSAFLDDDGLAVYTFVNHDRITRPSLRRGLRDRADLGCCGQAFEFLRVTCHTLRGEAPAAADSPSEMTIKAPTFAGSASAFLSLNCG